MPEIKITSDVAGRVCALPRGIGATVSEGDEVAFVEAMKMEIPVTSPATATIMAILVAIDDVVAEGQVLVVIEA